jgi:MFS family permease
MDIDIGDAFLRSTIACDTPIPTLDNKCPTGSFYQDGVCARVPPGEPGWSGSAHCMDKAYVIGVGTGFAGRLLSVGLVGKLVGNLLVGSMLVDTLGRKPVMVLAIVSAGVLSLLLAIASNLRSGILVIMLYATALLVFVTNGFHPAAMAMASDLTKNDDVQRSIAMTVINMFMSAGTTCGFIIGFFLLNMELEDYTTMWLTMSFLAALFAVSTAMTLKETLNARRLTVFYRFFTSRGSGCAAFTDVRRAFSMVWSDPVLRHSLVLGGLASSVSTFGCMSISSAWAISICGYNQAYASIMGMIKPAFIVLGSLISTVVVPIFGPYATGLTGLLMNSVGLAMTGIGAYHQELAPDVWWWGSGVLAGFGGGIGIPVFQGIWSTRVPQEDQGKMFAVMSLVFGVSSAFGTYAFTNLLFTNNLEGSRHKLAAPWIVGGFLQLLAFLANLMLCLSPTLRYSKSLATEPTRARSS